MDISERKKRILRAVIDDYIDTAEPVGSKAIAQDSELHLSSATIRNEMAELETMGYLEQPHTSAGRVPSPKGYRMYVNELMRRQKLSLEETEEINASLRMKMQQLDRLISDVGRLVSRVTSLPAYTLATAATRVTISRFDLIHVDAGTFIIVALLSNSTVKNKLVHLPVSIEPGMLVKLATVFNASFTGITDEKITPALISATERATGDSIGLVAVVAGFSIEILAETESAETYLSGTSCLLQHPEFRDIEKAQRILGYLSDSSELLKLPTPDDSDSLKIIIGPENVAEELRDSSVVVAKYNAGDNMKGLIGVVGPTRMNYSKIAARLSYIANGLNWLFGGGNIPPPVSGKDKESPPIAQGDEEN